jgi:error-prone DNA polymerase
MYPKRLILDDARQFGIAVLPLDVNTSAATYRVERVGRYDEPPPTVLEQPPRARPPAGLPDARSYGIRLSLAEVKGITDAEVARIVAGQPYHSMTDFWHRARVSRPVVERLVLAGGFDAVYGIGSSVPVRRRGRVTRRDLLLQVLELDRRSRATAAPARAEPVQLALDLDDPPGGAELSGLPEMTSAERVRAELDVLGLDVSRHVVDFYVPLLDALDVTRSASLLSPRSRSTLLVAGVKVATQTPPVRSGRRVVFLTLDDGTGPVDATFFEDAQGPYAATVFHSWLLLVRGVLRRTGLRGVSLRATGCWELPLLYDLWQRHGIEAVHDRLAQVPEGFGGVGEQALHGAAESRASRPVMARPDRFASDVADQGLSAGGMGRRRVLVHASGFRQSPYADIQPAGADVKSAPRKLWHSSPGSSGG